MALTANAIAMTAAVNAAATAGRDHRSTTPATESTAAIAAHVRPTALAVALANARSMARAAPTIASIRLSHNCMESSFASQANEFDAAVERFAGFGVVRSHWMCESVPR